MAPPTALCPHWHGHARGHSGPGQIGIQARKALRVSGHAGHTPCSAPTGTVCSRLRTSAETVVLVVPLLAHGGPVHALVAAWGVDERTGADWWARAGRQGQAGPASLVAPPRALGQGPAEESRVKQPGGIVGLARAMRGKTRVGLGGAVSAPRALPLLRRLSARGRRWAARRPLWVCTDGVVSSSRAMRETCRDPVPTGTGGHPRRRWPHGLSAQGVKRYARRRVVETAHRMVDGPPARVATLQRRSPGGGGIQTADRARLTATFRAHLAPLARRCRALARHTLTLHAGMCVVGTVENFGPPHERLAQAQKPTPARAAGSTDHGWTIREWLSLHVPLAHGALPKRRGRPSQALQHVMARWCAS